jgi:hypothetical protein
MPKIGAHPGVTDTLVPSAVRTTSGDTGILDGWGVPSVARFQLHATAASGTSPTLDVVVEDTLDGTNWNTVASFAQLSAVGRQVIDVTTLFAERIRVRWTVGGTTFSVVAYSE